MPDLDLQIRSYFDASSQPLTAGEVISTVGKVPFGVERRSRTWLVAAVAAVAVLVIGGILVLAARTDDSPVVTNTTTTVPPTSTTIAPPTTIASTPPAPSVALDLPLETDDDLAYAILRSLGSVVTLDRVAGGDAEGHDAWRSYSIEIQFFETAEEGAADLAEGAADARQGLAGIEEPGYPAPVEFEVPGLDTALAVTTYIQRCGRGCLPPELVTGIAFRTERVTVVVDGRVSSPFEIPEVQQAAVIDLALEIDARIRAALAGELEAVRVPLSEPLRSYAFNVNHAGYEYGGSNLERFNAHGVVTPVGLRCDVDGELDPASEVPPDSGTIRLTIDTGSHTLGMIDQEAAEAFWASVDLDSWWRVLGIADEYWAPAWPGWDPSELLFEAGIVLVQDNRLAGDVELESWEELLPGLPPGWVEQEVSGDDPIVTHLSRLCASYSPLLADGFGSAVEGREGTRSFLYGRDVISYELDRAAAVAAGLIADGDDLEVGRFNLVIDAVEPWLWSAVIDLDGPDRAMGAFGAYPPFTGQRVGLSLWLWFGSFNSVTGLDDFGDSDFISPD